MVPIKSLFYRADSWDAAGRTFHRITNAISSPRGLTRFLQVPEVNAVGTTAIGVSERAGLARQKKNALPTDPN